MYITVESFALRLLVAVLLYFFFDMLIGKFVSKPEAKNVFEIILIIFCVAIIFLGGFITLK